MIHPSTAETFVLSFVEKLILLEEKAGTNMPFRITPPFIAPLDDIVSIQRIAHQLAASIGLSRFIFVISFVKQKENVGGHIDLGTKGDDVFIEIDPDALAFPDSVGATLCHELSHKWLQVMGISSPIRMDDEILTDITAVFLGFGKIMLNGCEVRSYKIDKVPSGTITTTETRKSGYLSRDQLAFAYRLVCAMRNVPDSEFMAGLSPDAQSAIYACDRSFGEYYDSRFHQPDAVMAALKDFRTSSLGHQKRLADLNKHLDYIIRSFCQTVQNCITDGHKTLQRLSQKTEALASEVEPDPAMRFLRGIKKQHDFEHTARELMISEARINELLTHSTALAQHLWTTDSVFPRPSPEMFNIVKCPKDGTTLRLPMNSAELMVGCPACHYRFAYSTTCVTFDQPQSVAREPRWANNWWARVLSRFRT